MSRPCEGSTIAALLVALVAVLASACDDGRPGLESDPAPGKNLVGGAAGQRGECGGDRLATRVVGTGDLRIRALAGSSSPCVDDPCDPYCVNYTDSYEDVPLAPESGLVEHDGGIGILPTINEIGGGGSSCTGLAPMANVTMTVTSLSPLTVVPPIRRFATALVPPGCAAAAPLYGIDRYDVGTIDAATGVYSHGVAEPAIVTATAYVGGFTTSATVAVVVDAVDASAAPAGFDLASFGGGATSVEGAPLVLYPYDGTMFPLGLRAPRLMWNRAGGAPAKAVLVTLAHPQVGAPSFRFRAIVGEPSTPFFQIPQAAWDAFGQSARGGTGKLTLQRIDSTGKLQNPVSIALDFSTANLRGRIYYSEYSNGGNTGDVKVVLPYGTAGRTSAQNPANAEGNCGVCHSVSANGSKFVTSFEVASPRGPALNDYGISNVLGSGALQGLHVGPGGGGDSRGLAYAPVTRTGSYVLLGNNWWGNVNSGPNPTTPGSAGPKYKIYALPTAAGAASDVSNVGFGGAGNAWGLGSTQMYCPVFSPDNTRLMFVDADASGGAAARQGISFFTFDEAAQRFSNRTRFVRTTNVVGALPQNHYVRWPTFELDSRSVIFQSTVTTDDDGFDWYAGMLPSGCCGRKRVRGKLWSVDSGGPLGSPAPTAPVALARINLGLGNPSPLGGDDSNRSYQPTMLPAVVGGKRWVVFTSNRAYGNMLNGGASALSGMTNKLWVAAIDDAASGALDRSHPPFFLPNQSVSVGDTNERGFWSLDACKPADDPSSVCSGNDECCSGACVVDTPLTSPPTRHCKTTAFAACRAVGESCVTSAQCCGAPADVCSSGACQTPPPVVVYAGAGTFERDYQGVCADGTRVEWRFFDWKTRFPDSASGSAGSITFAARSAPTIPALGAAPSAHLGTQTATNTGWIGADVGAALGAATPPQKSREYLRITMTFAPSGDKTATPLLTEWRQLYDCVPSE